MPLITVIIPVRNGESTLPKCLTAIKEQTISNQLEVIVLDSMSTDKSRSIALAFGATVVDIPDGTFNHGLSRNVGVQHAKGELLYFTVQDAYLSETNQLERMAAHFMNNKVQSVTGIQGVPNDVDKNPAMWFKRFTEPVIEERYFAGNGFSLLNAEERLSNVRWDNVNSMYRKAALLQLPFRNTSFAEDILWAMDALHREWTIIRDPSLIVFHYHHQAFKYVFKADYICNYTIWQYFSILPPLPAVVKPIFRNAYTIFKRKHLSIFKKYQWIMHNVMRHLASFASALIFRLSFIIGNKKLLDKTYIYFCSVVPQGKQATANN